MKLANKAEAEKAVVCKHCEGKALYSYAGLLHLYAEIHREIKETLLWEQAKSNEEFYEQRRRKRNASDGEGIQAKNSNNIASVRYLRVLPQVPTRNYFAPLDHRRNSRTEKKTKTMVMLAQSSRYP
jgi:hypothetical protein